MKNNANVELLGGVVSRQTMPASAFALVLVLVLVLSEAVLVLDRFFSSTSTFLKEFRIVGDFLDCFFVLGACIDRCTRLCTFLDYLA